MHQISVIYFPDADTRILGSVEIVRLSDSEADSCITLLYIMRRLIIVSKAGKLVAQVGEANVNSFIALQSLRDRFQIVNTEINEPGTLRSLKMGTSELFICDLGEADAFIELQTDHPFKQMYTDLIVNVVYSVLSKKFLDILKNTPNADLTDQFMAQSQNISLIFNDLEKHPISLLFHYKQPT